MARFYGDDVYIPEIAEYIKTELDIVYPENYCSCIECEL